MQHLYEEINRANAKAEVFIFYTILSIGFSNLGATIPYYCSFLSSNFRPIIIINYFKNCTVETSRFSAFQKCTFYISMTILSGIINPQQKAHIKILKCQPAENKNWKTAQKLKIIRKL